MKRERRRPHGGKTRCISYIFYGNALVANKVILGSGDAELAAFTMAREVTTQTTELQ